MEEKLWGYCVTITQVRENQELFLLYTELTSLRKEQNDGVTDYIIRTEATVTALRNAALTLSNGLIIAMVLKWLPRTFNAFSIYV